MMAMFKCLIIGFCIFRDAYCRKKMLLCSPKPSLNPQKRQSDSIMQRQREGASRDVISKRSQGLSGLHVLNSSKKMGFKMPVLIHKVCRKSVNCQNNKDY